MDKMDSTSPTSTKHSRIHTHHRHRETYAPVTEILVPTVCAGIPAPKPASRIRHTSLSRSDSFDSSEEHWVGFMLQLNVRNLFFLHWKSSIKHFLLNFSLQAFRTQILQNYLIFSVMIYEFMFWGKKWFVGFWYSAVSVYWAAWIRKIW